MTRARSIANIGAAVDSGLSWRNRLINGGFQVAQRGPVAATAGVQYGPDRWLGCLLGASSISASFVASTLDGSLTGRGAFLSGSWTNGQPYFAQRIESFNAVDLNSQQITVSGKFFQDSGNTQTLIVRISKPTALDNWTSSTVVATASGTSIPSGALTPFSATFTLGSSDATNGLMVEIYFANAITVTNKNFALADVQLEAGSVANPFERRDIGRELMMCQRYYLKESQSNFYATYLLSTAARNTYYSYVTLRATMRANPTVSISYDNMHKPGTRFDAITSSTAIASSPRTFMAQFIVATNDDCYVGQVTSFAYAASAEL